MRNRSILLAAALALTAAPAAGEGVWSKVKRDFNTAVDSAKRGGRQAADAIGDGAKGVADGVGGTVREAAGQVDNPTRAAPPLPPPRPQRGNAADQ